ncbi:hypothetical protein GCM10009734_79850 [Nonomuraea bangladeshensis]
MITRASGCGKTPPSATPGTSPISEILAPVRDSDSDSDSGFGPSFVDGAAAVPVAINPVVGVPTAFAGTGWAGGTAAALGAPGPVGGTAAGF